MFRSKKSENTLPRSIKDLDKEMFNYRFFPIFIMFFINYFLPNAHGSFLVLSTEILFSYIVVGIGFSYFKSKGYLDSFNTMTSQSICLILIAEKECWAFRKKYHEIKTHEKYLYEEINDVLVYLYEIYNTKHLYRIKFIYSLITFRFFDQFFKNKD